MEAIRELRQPDYGSVLVLNDAEVRQTSPMDMERLESLARMSAYRRVVAVDGQVAAFLLALREGAPYANVNYEWFSRRFQRFLYVDRVVVGAGFSGRGIGSRLYEDLFAFARSKGVEAITCEYNIEPPNPASSAFHGKFGFRELGTQWVAGGSKRVSLQAAAVTRRHRAREA